jgi:translocation protein SEC62
MSSELEGGQNKRRSTFASEGLYGRVKGAE